MSILIVEDSAESRNDLQNILKQEGFFDFLSAESVEESFDYLGITNPEKGKYPVDLILLDALVQNVDTIDALNQIKSSRISHNIPVIILTDNNDNDYIMRAFGFGAIDYITKPFHKIDLIARIKSALRLKCEMDNRINLTAQLEEANRRLESLSQTDILTGLFNRKYFEASIKQEWKRAVRINYPISMIIIRMDNFGSYKEQNGESKSIRCLKNISQILKQAAKRPADVVARYGEDKFIINLPDTSCENAAKIAEKLRGEVETMRIPHGTSKASNYVTISIGVASIYPDKSSEPKELISSAEKMLQKAISSGQNRVMISEY